MGYSVSVVLPHGFTADGKKWLRSIRLRELNGHDERYLSDLYELLQEVESDLSTFRKTIELLARVIVFDKSTTGLTTSSQTSINAKKSGLVECGGNSAEKDLLTRLTIGDRCALLFQFQRLMFGEVMKCELSCPLCHEMISLEVPVLDLLLPPKPISQSNYEVKVNNFAIKLRPVNGKDQEELLSFSKSSKANDVYEYSSVIIRSCVLSSDPPLPESLSSDNELVNKISSKLGELDPQADIVLDIKCTHCTQSFKVSFVIEDFVCREIEARLPQLDNEIDLIASRYHWSENDILSLPSKRRKRYVDLINGTYER